MQMMQELQRDQHDNAYQNHRDISNLTDEMGNLSFCVEDLHAHVYNTGEEPPRPRRGGVRTLGRRAQGESSSSRDVRDKNEELSLFSLFLTFLLFL